ncbi:hypothetical protein ACE3KD_08335, partial [Enterobacter hormaechei subsp. steigerwaltii]
CLKDRLVEYCGRPFDSFQAVRGKINPFILLYSAVNLPFFLPLWPFTHVEHEHTAPASVS